MTRSRTPSAIKQLIYAFEFRSYAFGVISEHALKLVSYLFQRTHKKKAEKEKPIDEDLVDSTGLMGKLRKRRSSEGVRETDVHDSLRGFAFFKHAFAIRILWRPRKNMTLGSQIFSSAA